MQETKKETYVAPKLEKQEPLKSMTTHGYSYSNSSSTGS